MGLIKTDVSEGFAEIHFDDHEFEYCVPDLYFDGFDCIRYGASCDIGAKGPFTYYGAVNSFELGRFFSSRIFKSASDQPNVVVDVGSEMTCLWGLEAIIDEARSMQPAGSRADLSAWVGQQPHAAGLV